MPRIRREQGPEPDPGTSVAPPLAPRTSAQAVLRLQRSAGNAAVTRWLARDPETMIKEGRALDKRRRAEEEPLRDESEWEDESEPEPEPEPEFYIPTPQLEVHPRQPRRQDAKLETLVGVHAANIPPKPPPLGVQVPGNPAAAAEDLFAPHRPERERVRKKQERKAGWATEAAAQKLAHSGEAKPADPVADAHAANKASEQERATRGKAEPAHVKLRADAKEQLARVPGGFLRVPLAATVKVLESIADAKTHDLGAATAQVAQAKQEIDERLALEASYATTRAKATDVKRRYEQGTPAYRRNLKSVKDALPYAEGKTPHKPDQSTALILIRNAETELDQHDKNWAEARTSRDTFFALRMLRFRLGFPDAKVDELLEEAERDSQGEDFWDLKATVEKLTTAMAPLNKLESNFQGLLTRITYAKDKMGIGPEVEDAVNKGFAARAKHPDPNALYADLSLKLRVAEDPTIQHDFHALRLSGDYEGATQGLVALVNAGLARPGGINGDPYLTSYDKKGGFSVEYLIDGIPEIVLHLHLTSDGTPIAERNAAHWKPASVKKLPGKTNPLPFGTRDKLVDKAELKKLKPPLK